MMKKENNNAFPVLLLTGLSCVLIGAMITYTLVKKTENPIDDVRSDLDLIRWTLLIGLIIIGGLMIYGFRFN
jgi:hypothetical protein